MMIDIQLLGSMTASARDASFVPTAAKPRQLLAILAVNTGRVLPFSVLIEEMWGSVPPRSANTTLHTYIGKLRGMLTSALGDESPHGAKDVLRTEGVGYRLNAPRESVDCRRYESLAKAGRRAADAGDYPAAARTLAEALAQWHGPALADVRHGPHLMIEATRLEQSRLSDLDLRIEADLHLGRHRTLLGELAGLCARHAMSENFGVQYMLALYRSGQRWRALEVYQRLRTTMIDQLGLEPSAAAQQLHWAILRGDPGIDDLAFTPGDRTTADALAG